MNWLLDTNVLSELRKAGDGRAHPGVITWFSGIDPASCFVSVISVMELEIGILRVARRDPVQAGMLGDWLRNQVLPTFTGRILAIDLEVARRCAGLHVPDPRAERDALIAATAMVHAMTVVTRNVADFAATGVTTLDPWR